MKKLLSLGLVASLSLTGLVACGGNDAETPAETPSNGSAETTEKPATSGEKVEIKLWLDDDDYAAAIEPAIEAAYPNIDVVYEKVGAVDARTKLELDGPAGLGGDVFIQPHDGMSESILSNILLPLGSDLGNMIEERMLEGAVGTVKVDNTYYGIPLATESLALFYNKTLLEENGFEVATSFEQIKEQAAQYNDAATNKFLLRFQPGNSYDMHFFLTGAGFQLYGENHDDASQVNLNTPEVVAGLEFFKSMKEYLPVPYADLNWDTVHGEFIKGNVPYMISGPWSIAEAKQGAIDNEFEWGVTTIPTINGVQPETFSGNIIACVSAYTQHPTEAKQVAEFLASEEGLQIMYDVQGKI
ncbi:extracellular solute-binding protein, partial [Turicibacter sanguinis]|nr:extracellular solute-binding protein [Turicibacter sanguinis]MTQ51422.1 extracellular solute-binding protein [Turicibacter sanguinis]